MDDKLLTVFVLLFALSHGAIVLPLKGDAVAGFSVTCQIGLPAQDFMVMVDTGSADLLIYNDDCQGCGTNKYNFSLSTTASIVSCQSNMTCDSCGENNECLFDSMFGDGSEGNGTVFRDVITFGQQGAPITFGAISYANDEMKESPFDGVFGVSAQPDSSWGGTMSWLDWATYNNEDEVLALCLQTSSPSMILGTSNTSYQWTSMYGAYMTVELIDIAVGKKSVSVTNATAAYLDSGTTVNFVSQNVLKSMWHIIRGMCSKVNLKGVCNVPHNESIFAGNCVPMQPKDIAQFPSMTFTFQGIAPLTLSPFDYLFSTTDADQQLYCWSFYANNDASEDTILGNTFMRGFNIAFSASDLLVGFADVNSCP